MLSEVTDEDEVEVFGILGAQSRRLLGLKMERRPRPGARSFRFRPRRLSTVRTDAAIEIFHYRSRFKREADPETDRSSGRGLDSHRGGAALARTGAVRRPILSKMIRRAIPDPRMVQDLLGAMFIVGDRSQAYALERRLVAAFGGPLRCRDRVTRSPAARDGGRLDPQSSSGFSVLKEIVEILMDDPSSDVPYLFSVELQIFRSRPI